MITVLSMLSIVTFAAYGWDKLAARRGTLRISEGTLHLLALAGGWPGGLAGQLLFHHKTRKNTFQLYFWLTVLVNGAMLIFWQKQRLP
jgi:uncharacterized membrane protein YsdA (DUF1294 family)